jgi:hypothetical protein
MSGSSSALLQAARLWEETSGKGTRYMQGRLGGVKLVILPNRDYVEGDPPSSNQWDQIRSVMARLDTDPDETEEMDD